MFTKSLLLSVAALASAQSIVQGPAPSEVLLTETKSGVLPTLPTETPFVGVETLEGAIVMKGQPNPGYTGLLGDAVVQMNTPGKSFKAVLPNTNFNPYTGSTVTGSLTATVPANGTGVMITVNLMGLPAGAQYSPFVYHIHGAAVPADGNCTATMGHLDPTNRGEYYPCIAAQPQTCQAGDLTGKHGKVMNTTFTASYLELYLSTDPSSAYYIGDKSFVVHTMNTTRLTCANFVASMNSTSTMAPTSTSTPAAYTGAANVLAVSGALLGGSLFAAFSFL